MCAHARKTEQRNNQLPLRLQSLANLGKPSEAQACGRAASTTYSQTAAYATGFDWLVSKHVKKNIQYLMSLSY